MPDDVMLLEKEKVFDEVIADQVNHLVRDFDNYKKALELKQGYEELKDKDGHINMVSGDHPDTKTSDRSSSTPS